MGKRPGESTGSFRIRQLREIEEAIESEPELFVDGPRGNSSRHNHNSNKTEVIAPQDQPKRPLSNGGYSGGENVQVCDDMLNQDDLETHLENGVKTRDTGRTRRTEKGAETAVIGIGKGPRRTYIGSYNPGFVVKDIAEKTFGEGILAEGDVVEVLVLGYELRDQRILFVDDKFVGVPSPPYKLVKQPEGHILGEPALQSVTYPVSLADMLNNHPKGKGLTEEEKTNVKVFVQVLKKSKAEELEVLNQALQVPTVKPEESQGRLAPDFGSDAEMRLDSFFGEGNGSEYRESTRQTEEEKKRKDIKSVTEMFPFNPSHL